MLTCSDESSTALQYYDTIFLYWNTYRQQPAFSPFYHHHNLISVPQWDTLGIIWGFDNAIIHNCQNREKLILTEVDWTHTGLQLHHNTFFLLDRVSFHYLSHNRRDIGTINASYFRGSEQYVFSDVRKSIVATKCFWQQDRNDIVYKWSIFWQLVRDCTSKSNITTMYPYIICSQSQLVVGAMKAKYN